MIWHAMLVMSIPPLSIGALLGIQKFDFHRQLRKMR